jgi:hypothetical protein
MDIDPMKRNIQMKNVAEFHSCDFVFFFKAELGEPLRKGLGISPRQNDGCMTLGRVEYGRGSDG